MPRRLPASAYIDGVLRGDRVLLARAITLLESTLPSDSILAMEVVEACMGAAGPTRRIGVTGVPGAGKSTFLEALGMHLIEACGESVAVLSIDPTSPVSGGSILGDKTRMERLSSSPRAFIRPSPSGGHLGGVARTTRETMLLCEAAGFANIFIETVGVGQSETTVRGMVDTFLLLALAGAGDELQGIKRGITEITDLVVVNKADGDNMRPAMKARAELETALHYFPPSDDGWRPCVLTCSSRTRTGISEVWDTVLAHEAAMRQNGKHEWRRREQSLEWMRDWITVGLRQRFQSDPRIAAAIPRLELQVRAGEMSSFRAAEQLLTMFHGSLTKSENRTTEHDSSLPDSHR